MSNWELVIRKGKIFFSLLPSSFFLLPSSFFLLPLTLSATLATLGRFTATADNQRVAALVFAPGFGTQCWFTPRSYRPRAPDGSSAFTTTMRVVNWVHCRSADGWAAAFPAGAAGFTKADVSSVCVADLTDGGVAVGADFALFTRGQFEGNVATFFCH